MLAQDSGEVVPASILRFLGPSLTEVDVMLPISEVLFPGSVITVAVANITINSPVEFAGMSADVSPTDGTVRVTVPDSAANIVFGFTSESLSARVDES